MSNAKYTPLQSINESINSGDDVIIHSMPASPSMKSLDPSTNQSMKALISITGMTCSACSGTIERQLINQPNVVSARVSLMTETAEVIYHAPMTSEQLVDSVIDVGFDASIITPEQESSVKISCNNLDESTNQSEIQSMLLAMEGVLNVSFESDVVLSIDEDDQPINQSTKPSIIHLSVDVQRCRIRSVVKSLQLLGLDCSSVRRSGSLDDRRATYESMKAIELLRWQRLCLTSLFFTVPCMLIIWISPYIDQFNDLLDTTLHNAFDLRALLLWLLVTPVQFGVGSRFYKHGWSALRHGGANMDVLVALGSTAAYLYSVLIVILCINNEHFHGMVFFETSAMLITIVILSKYVEHLAKGKTSEAISGLIKLQPQHAMLVSDQSADESSDQSIEQIDVSLVELGDLLLVHAGTSVPVDGVVVKGVSSINESMLTGESLPVPKRPGSKVIGATINLDAPITIRVTGVGSDTVLSKIVSLVNDAQTSKAPIEAYADKVARWFVPAVCCLSLLTLITWWIILEYGLVDKSTLPAGTNSFLFSFMIGMSVLLISCPCALGLACPCAVIVGCGVGARMGVLFKGGEPLETTGEIKACLFDKTGTLTQGHPAVEKDSCIFQVDDQLNEKKIWLLIGSLENQSEHVLAKALVAHSKKATDNAPLLPVLEYVNESGAGVKGIVDSHLVVIGNRRFLAENGCEVEPELVKHMSANQSLGKIVVLCSINRQVRAMISLSDSVKPEARSVIAALQARGIDCYMVTGDHKLSAQAIGLELGLDPDHIISQVTPADKSSVVERLQESVQHGGVAFVGDGVNDSPALARADVGIAIGSGTDVAVETAQVVLMRSDLTDVLTAISLSQAVMKRIALNFAWACLYNLLAIPLAAGILYPWTHMTLPPVVAALAMGASSISVVASSLMLRRFNKECVLRELALVSHNDGQSTRPNRVKQTLQSLVDRIRPSTRVSKPRYELVGTTEEDIEVV